MRQIIETKDAPSPIGPYSQAISANGLVFVSGQIPIIPETGAMVEGGVDAQTRQVLQNVAAILAAAGSSLQKVVKTTIYLRNLDDFARVNQIYSEYFAEAKPARATVQVARLPKEAMVEIDAVALV